MSFTVLTFKLLLPLYHNFHYRVLIVFLFLKMTVFLASLQSMAGEENLILRCLNSARIRALESVFRRLENVLSHSDGSEDDAPAATPI